MARLAWAHMAKTEGGEDGWPATSNTVIVLISVACIPVISYANIILWSDPPAKMNSQPCIMLIIGAISYLSSTAIL